MPCGLEVAWFKHLICTTSFCVIGFIHLPTQNQQAIDFINQIKKSSTSNPGNMALKRMESGVAVCLEEWSLDPREELDF